MGTEDFAIEKAEDVESEYGLDKDEEALFGGDKLEDQDADDGALLEEESEEEDTEEVDGDEALLKKKKKNRKKRQWGTLLWKKRRMWRASMGLTRTRRRYSVMTNSKIKMLTMRLCWKKSLRRKTQKRSMEMRRCSRRRRMKKQQGTLLLRKRRMWRASMGLTRTRRRYSVMTNSKIKML